MQGVGCGKGGRIAWNELRYRREGVVAVTKTRSRIFPSGLRNIGETLPVYKFKKALYIFGSSGVG